jgi:uncharacterized membrane protein YoaK (UPF0700 family)
MHPLILPTRSASVVEERLGVATLLAACGGFLDAFTYLAHGHVFANAMTGNVVLLGVDAATARWSESFDHLRPILAFLSGVAVAQGFRLPRFRRWIPEAPIAALTLEIVALLAGGWFPKGFAGTPLVLGISFVAALQSSTFRKAAGFNYNSTMTTGNLRIFGEAAFERFFASNGMSAFEKAKTFGAICLAFLAGAILGGVCTAALDNRALWIVDALLAALWVRLFVALRFSRRPTAG